jgi:hypothetical protein
MIRHRFARQIHTSVARYQQSVRVSEPLRFGYTELDPQFKVGYSPLYTSPSHKFVSLLKRTSLGFGMVGIYISQLMYSTPTLFSEPLIYLTMGLSIVPLPLIHILTQHHVTRIWRLYDSTKPQTLEALTEDETLVAEKISLTGRSYYNSLIKVQDLEIVDRNTVKATWKAKDALFYVKDNVGGIKMDRIWGIAEHHSGIDNGRFFGK